MLFNKTLVSYFCVLMALSCLAACSSMGKSVPDKPATVTIKAESTINPNTAGLATPVVVIIYQLKEQNNFNNAEFFNLYQNPRQTLGPDYITSKQTMVAPGATIPLGIVLKSETRYIGIVAAFQQLNSARWQAIMPIERKHLPKRINITIAATNVQFEKE